MNHADLSTLIEAAKAVLWIKDNWEWFAWGFGRVRCVAGCGFDSGEEIAFVGGVERHAANL